MNMFRVDCMKSSKRFKLHNIQQFLKQSLEQIGKKQEGHDLPGEAHGLGWIAMARAPQSL